MPIGAKRPATARRVGEKTGKHTMRVLTASGVRIARRRASFGGLILVLALSLAGAPVGNGARAGPDVAMTDDLLFVADPLRGVVLQGPIEAGRISLAKLAPVAALRELKHPIALDARGSRLVVLDADGPTVLDVDLRANTVRVLVRGAPLREPTGIAIAGGGTVAVTDPSNRALFLFSDSKEVQIDRRLSVPLQVEFDASEDALYVYDAERGLLRVEYSSVENFVRMRNAERIVTTPLTGAARVFSFAPRRGLLYLADESGLRVAIPAKRSTLTVPPQYYRRRFTSIALNPQFLAGIDDAGTSIEVMDRPLPVSVNLDPENGDPNTAMLALLDYLAARRLLAGRGVDLREPGEPYERVLGRYNVLVPTSASAGARPLDQARLRSLFCALNPRQCGGAAAPEGQSEVAIPQVTVEPYLAVSKRALEGKSVENHIQEKVVDPAQRADVTAEYIAALNPNTDGTLESEWQRRRLVMAVPMSGALSPGTVIRVAGNNETPAGDLAARCGVTPEREISKTFLPETITTRALAALPDEVRAEAAAASVSEVELGFDRVVLEIIAVPRGCRVAGGGEKEYLITEAVKVDALRYRLRTTQPSARGKPAAQAQSARAPVWKVVGGPFVLAYKAVDLASVAMGLPERSIDPARLKPGLVDEGAILRRTSGEANLPATHWRFDVLVPASDYLATSSPLAEVRRANRSLGLSSHERVLASARSVFLRPVPASTADVKVTLIDARKNLSKTISYSDDLAAGTEAFYVAVGEADEQVNQDHQGFIHGGRSAWFEATADGLVRRRVPQAAVVDVEAAIHQLNRLDHGTHVAGIIGARASSLMPGLTPSVRLYLVDTAGNLTDAIQDAYQNRLRIFNFSFAITPDPEAAQERKSRMVQHWTEALFIVAAGNEGRDLNRGGSEPLVSWVTEVPNIIGVGGARADGLDVMSAQPNPSEPGATLPGSNFGSRFVHLIAPGEQIYSLGDQQYAFATGTSQAVPQVTAAAVILSARMLAQSGVKIKARLIATANWSDGLKGKVWGGLLDVDRAVMHLTRNVLRIQSAPQSVRAITLDDDVMLTIKSATSYPSDGTEGTFTNELRVPFRKVLRLQHLGSSKFRIVMIDAMDHLTIMFGKVEGRIACTEMTRYDETAERFVPLPPGTADPCAAGGIQVQQFQDYVATASAIPERVKF
jgi:Subtilase family